jgi:hypothetical protein
MTMAKLKYIIELAVDETWIADGFDIKDKYDVLHILQNVLPYAYASELGGRVISKPKASVIKKLQGE